MALCSRSFRFALTALVIAISIVFAGTALAQSKRQPVYTVIKEAGDSFGPGRFGSIQVYEIRDGALQLTGIESYALGCLPPVFPAEPCPPQPVPVAAGDLNGDGADEFVLADSSILDQFVDIRDITGSPIRSWDSGEDLPSVTTGDWDGDGADDIAVWKAGRIEVFDESGTSKTVLTLSDFDKLLMGNVDADPEDEFLILRGTNLEQIEPDGTPIRNLALGTSTFAVGDTDVDGVDELALRAQGIGQGITVDIVEADGTVVTSFTEPFGATSGQIGLADMLGGAEVEVLLGVAPVFGSPASLVVYDLAGNELTRWNGALNSIIGPVRLMTGRGGPVDGDADGLPDAWETGGLRIGNQVLDLAGLGAGPDQKDLFVEFDWMIDPLQRETGDGPGQTCSDMIDNDGDGIADFGDPDCADPFRNERTPGGCTDGLDNNADGLVDLLDPGCGIIDPNLAEGPSAAPGTCNDTLDNDGDGTIDRSDTDCRTLDPNGFEGTNGTNVCGDGFDNDGDGDTDADDTECYVPTFDEAGPGSCTDGIDNDGDGRTDGDDFDCVSLPTQAEVRAVQQAFCAAPADAAGGNPSPDVVPGIRFWLDVGNAPADLNGIETPIRPCTCGDGIDNDGDGVADANDFDCLTRYMPGDPRDRYDASRAEVTQALLVGSCNDQIDNDGDGDIDSGDADCAVGDDLGGGNRLPSDDFCGLGDTFYDFRGDNFSSIRKQAFHYGISGNCSGQGKPGGLGEVGGNDFVSFTRSGRTLFHEIGHNLGLRHGGDESKNCKPNYVSSMNYATSPKLQRRSGETFLDFAPPRYPGGRGKKIMPRVVEDDLVEAGTALDLSDAYNRFVHTDPAGNAATPQIDGDQDGDGVPEGINWDADPMNVYDGAIDPINLNLSSTRCDSDKLDEKFDSHDDWSNIGLGLVWGTGAGLPDSDDGPVQEVEPPELNTEELEEQRLKLEASDLSALKTAAIEVEVGDPLAYSIEITNEGPNPARAVAFTDTLPDRVTLLSAPDACTQAGRTLTCAIGGLASSETQTFEAEVDTNGICDDGVPPKLQNRVEARHAADEDRGLDTNPSNDAALVSTQAIDTTPPVIACNTPVEIVPPDAPITFTATAVDLCDDDVTVEVLEFDCFAIKRDDRIVDKTESCIVSISGADTQVVDTGGVDDHITWTVQATDRAGNVATAECEVLVAHPNDS